MPTAYQQPMLDKCNCFALKKAARQIARLYPGGGAIRRPVPVRLGGAGTSEKGRVSYQTRSPHQSGDPPYDPKERGDRRVRPVASDSERARLAEVDDKSADEVNPDQHAHDRYEQVRPRHHQLPGHHPP